MLKSVSNSTNDSRISEAGKFESLRAVYSWGSETLSRPENRAFWGHGRFPPIVETEH